MKWHPHATEAWPGTAKHVARRSCTPCRQAAPRKCLPANPSCQLLNRILIAVMAEASSIVIICANAADVGPITDATIEWTDRLTS
jgi:hypothetical protein